MSQLITIKGYFPPEREEKRKKLGIAKILEFTVRNYDIVGIEKEEYDNEIYYSVIITLNNTHIKYLSIDEDQYFKLIKILYEDKLI